MRNKRLYNIWQGMKQRCNNPKHPAAHWYHDKGIRVCDEWLDFEKFQSWSLVNDYTDNLSIDRINSDGNYEPDNCRWISIEQNRQKALKSRKPNSEKTNTKKRGRFMVVKMAGPFWKNDVQVVKIGLTKSDALMLSKNLKMQEPYSSNYFYCRVATKNKEGDFIDWYKTRAYLNSK